MSNKQKCLQDRFTMQFNVTESAFLKTNLFICERITVCSAICDSDITDNFYAD